MRKRSRRGIPEVPQLNSGDKLVSDQFWLTCCGCGLRHLFVTDKMVTLQVFVDEWGTEAIRAVRDYPMVERKKRRGG